MALEKAQKERLVAIIYTVSAVVLGLVAIFMLFSAFQSVQSQRKQIEALQAQAQTTQTEILELTRQIKTSKESAEAFIPSNFEEFFNPDTSNSQLTRMFDELETRYQSNGQTFLINSISYGQATSSDESQTQAVRANLSLSTSQENLLTFLRDIEKTSLSPEEAFYYLDPQSLNFSNVTADTIGEEISVDLQVDILLRKNNG